MKTAAKYCALCACELPDGTETQTQLDGREVCPLCVVSPPASADERVVKEYNRG